MLEPEPEPEPLGLPGAVPMSSLTPPARLPPLQQPAKPRAAKQQRNAKEELARKRLSELCKLARAKDIDQFDIDEAVASADPRPAMLALLAGKTAPVAQATRGAEAGCSGAVPPGQRELELLCVTWNLKGTTPSEPLTPLLPPGYDVYAIATQESCSSIQKSMVWNSKKEWEDMVSAQLPKHRMVTAATLGATHLIVMVRTTMVEEGALSDVRSATLATGFGNVMPNKGGAGICLRLYRTTLLFVSAHFTAHQHKVADRNADFQRINAELPLHCEVPPRHPPGTPLTDRFDMVFWLGDLNYRIDGNRSVVRPEQIDARSAFLLACFRLSAAVLCR